MAKCLECAQLVSRGGTDKKNFNTTNLSNHLKRKHFRLYQSLICAQQKEKAGQAMKSQAAVTSMYY